MLEISLSPSSICPMTKPGLSPNSIMCCSDALNKQQNTTVDFSSLIFIIFF